MSKDSIVRIQAGCRVAGYVSDTSRKKNIAEVFDVLEVTPDGQFRCHLVGTRFDHDARHIYLQEHEISWCRLPDGREFFRKTPEDKWQDMKLLGQ